MRLALAGDTMLGRKVADALANERSEPLVAPDVVEVIHEADLFVLNLECCISERGSRWPDPGKPFFFRAPPSAVEQLVDLGVDCVTLANNHALDFGADALLDTFEHLAAAGIAWVGAGTDVERARAPAVLQSGDFRLGIVGATDHPNDFAAGPDRAGVALAELGPRVSGWLLETVRALDTDATLVTPHWGPNMAREPGPSVRAAAARLVEAGATLVAGHSAHVFHGVEGRVLYDLGDFLDDYAVDPALRNDLGLLFLVNFDGGRAVGLEAVPLRLEFCRTRLANAGETAWIARRFREACALLGTDVTDEEGRLFVAMS